MSGSQLGEVRRVGGWRGSPNSIAALQNRVLIQDQRKCRRCRRQAAVRGYDLCSRHLGRWSPLSAGAGRGESRQLAALERCGLLPLDLLALPLWRNLAGIKTAVRAPLRLALVQAWDQRLTEPLYWARVQRQAIEAGAAPGRRYRVASWYQDR